MNEMCACLKVEYIPVVFSDGRKEERWMCPECKSIFVRKKSAMCEANSNAVLGDVLRGVSEEDFMIKRLSDVEQSISATFLIN